ncbi:MAG: 2-oxoacid:acceptor oxidoreductase family protein [Planctomycetes bacterium]|nr:2-oxoacid:acceptor oxidoreductase family protein [Planctomycetota bacterium]
MIRIRFHGRGGHGIKTASRIVGTAAFLAGHQVQDSPIYGAERRGSPVAAFVRISDDSILERGSIEQPDLIIVADETLLDDSAASVLVGLPAAAAVFVNCDRAAAARIHLPELARRVAFDVSGRSLEILGQASAISSGIAAAAVRLAGVATLAQLLQATQEELAMLEVSPESVERNRQIAREVFTALAPIEIVVHEAPSRCSPMVSVAYDGAILGAPSILAPGNAAQSLTGNWRVTRPIIDRDICTRCGLCFVQCPDGAISLDAEGYPVIDYDHCKGCLICRQVCPVAAIETRKEVRAW